MTNLTLNQLLRKYSAGFEIEWTGMEMVDAEQQMFAELDAQGIDLRREGYNHTTQNYWKLVSDNTVTQHRNYSRGTGFGGEFVSPVLKTNTLDTLEKFCKAMNNATDSNGQTIGVNSNCSVHIHISWDNMELEHIKTI